MIQRLQVRNFRILEAVDFRPGPRINWFRGQNGAGKTSLLEALAVLGRGRSFRSTRIAGLIRSGESALQVVAHGQFGEGGVEVLGVERGAESWTGRIAGAAAIRVSEFARRLPLVVVEPGSHALVDGGPDERRRYLDWTMFHVEHDYLGHWRGFVRALRQRNAALRTRQPEHVVRSLDGPLVRHALALDSHRRRLVDSLSSRVQSVIETVGLRLPSLTLSYRQGWARHQDYAAALDEGWDTDRDRGFTGRGPQRGDLEIRADGAPAGGRLSRGQQKLVSLALLLAQHEILESALGRPPLLLLDDPVSELDADHLDRLMQWVQRGSGQVFVTAVSDPRDLGLEAAVSGVFHVEHGRVVAADPDAALNPGSGV